MAAGSRWHAARLALTWPNRLVRCYQFCRARVMGEWSPPINQQEEIGREATVEAPSAQTRKDYPSRPGALSRFFRMNRDGWKSKYKDLKATVKGDKNRLAHLTRSREQWRIRAERAGEQITTLEVEIAVLTTDYYPGNQDPHKSLQPIRSSNSRSRLPRDQRSTTESTEIHGKENPNQLPLSVSFRAFRGYAFVMIFLARSWGRASGVSRSGPDSVRAAQKVLVAERPAGTLMRAEGFQLLFSDGAGQQTAPVGGHLQQRSDLELMPSSA